MEWWMIVIVVSLSIVCVTILCDIVYGARILRWIVRQVGEMQTNTWKMRNNALVLSFVVLLTGLVFAAIDLAVRASDDSGFKACKLPFIRGKEEIPLTYQSLAFYWALGIMGGLLLIVAVCYGLLWWNIRRIYVSRFVNEPMSIKLQIVFFYLDLFLSFAPTVFRGYNDHKFWVSNFLMMWAFFLNLGLQTNSDTGLYPTIVAASFSILATLVKCWPLTALEWVLAIGLLIWYGVEFWYFLWITRKVEDQTHISLPTNIQQTTQGGGVYHVGLKQVVGTDLERIVKDNPHLLFHIQLLPSSQTESLPPYRIIPCTRYDQDFRNGVQEAVEWDFLSTYYTFAPIQDPPTPMFVMGLERTEGEMTLYPVPGEAPRDTQFEEVSEGLHDSMEDERDLDQIMNDRRAAEMELESRDARVSNNRRIPQLLHDQAESTSEAQETPEVSPVNETKTEEGSPKTTQTEISEDSEQEKDEAILEEAAEKVDNAESEAEKVEDKDADAEPSVQESDLSSAQGTTVMPVAEKTLIPEMEHALVAVATEKQNVAAEVKLSTHDELVVEAVNGTEGKQDVKKEAVCNTGEIDVVDNAAESTSEAQETPEVSPVDETKTEEGSPKTTQTEISEDSEQEKDEAILVEAAEKVDNAESEAEKVEDKDADAEPSVQESDLSSAQGTEQTVMPVAEKTLIPEMEHELVAVASEKQNVAAEVKLSTHDELVVEAVNGTEVKQDGKKEAVCNTREIDVVDNAAESTSKAQETPEVSPVNETRTEEGSPKMTQTEISEDSEQEKDEAILEEAAQEFYFLAVYLSVEEATYPTVEELVNEPIAEKSEAEAAVSEENIEEMSKQPTEETKDEAVMEIREEVSKEVIKVPVQEVVVEAETPAVQESEEEGKKEDASNTTESDVVEIVAESTSEPQQRPEVIPVNEIETEEVSAKTTETKISEEQAILEEAAQEFYFLAVYLSVEEATYPTVKEVVEQQVDKAESEVEKVEDKVAEVKPSVQETDLSSAQETEHTVMPAAEQIHVAEAAENTVMPEMEQTPVAVATEIEIVVAEEKPSTPDEPVIEAVNVTEVKQDEVVGVNEPTAEEVYQRSVSPSEDEAPYPPVKEAVQHFEGFIRREGNVTSERG